ncbi:MAG: leucyl aminopeptidase family protein [Gammaproteobacteria bacterium]|nr:leucyl aminopeptidase family protein [Gammaproteobacteria bacterium]
MLNYKNYEASNISIVYNQCYSKSDHHTLVISFSSPTEATWQQLPHGKTLFSRWQASKIDNLETFFTMLPNDLGTNIAIINLEKYKSTYKRLEIIRKQIVQIACDKPKVLNIILTGAQEQDPTQAQEAEIINHIIACAGSFYTLLPRISKKIDITPNKDLELHVYGARYNNHNHERAIAEVHGNGLTRFLCNFPANYLYPEVYSDYVKQIAQEQSWQYEFLDINILKQKNAGAFLAVVQGSSRKDAGIVKLTYIPKNLSKTNKTKTISLVGKGMCFDTGGYNLKTPLGSMYSMNHDMTGSAIVLGTLLALSNLKVPFKIEAWLALAQNDIGPDAYKPSDVVYASNGMSIEVINTDAEGRMVLCDTLHLASLDKPDLIMDYATLTGSCVRALDELYSGVVTNRSDWNNKLIEIGQECGERVWPFPYTEDYDEVLKSDIADIKQCHEGPADQIRAARFLGKFIENNIPWIHIDLSSHAHKGGLAHINTETTGFGVRFTLSCLLDNNLLQ